MRGRVFDDDQREKYDFVRITLTHLLRQVLCNDHYMAEFFVDDGGELVDITFDNEYHVRKINVSADSLLELTRDVLKHF